jgi:hypothetical protein
MSPFASGGRSIPGQQHITFVQVRQLLFPQCVLCPQNLPLAGKMRGYSFLPAGACHFPKDVVP